MTLLQLKLLSLGFKEKKNNTVGGFEMSGDVHSRHQHEAPLHEGSNFCPLI
jgi:hypothetical protein